MQTNFYRLCFCREAHIRWARCINKACILRRQPRMRIEYREGTFARNIPDVFFYVIAATAYE